jgi:hypothetical protein
LKELGGVVKIVMGPVRGIDDLVFPIE